MVTHFNKSLTELEGMNQHQFVVEIERNLQVVLLDVLVSIKKDIMSIFVVSKLLFLLRNIFLLFYTKINANFIAYLSVYHEERVLLHILNRNYNFLAKKNYPDEIEITINKATYVGKIYRNNKLSLIVSN